MPGIVSALHPAPDSGAVAEKLAETHRDGGGYRLSLSQDVVKVLARDAEQSGDLGLGAARSRNDVIAKQCAGMSGAAVLAALGCVGHVCSSSDIARKSTRQISNSLPSK